MQWKRVNTRQRGEPGAGRQLLHLALMLGLVISLALGTLAPVRSADAAEEPAPVITFDTTSICPVDGPCLNIPNQRGPVIMSSVEVYLIFWAPPGSEFAPDVANGNELYMNLIKRFFTDIGGSPMFNILSQYHDLENGSPRYRPNVLTLADSYVDTRAYPQAPLSKADIEGAITNAIAVNSWPITPNTPPPNDKHLNKLYFVYTPTGVQTCLDDAGTNRCSGDYFAGYHDYFEHTPKLKYVYIADVGPHESVGSIFPNNRYADSAISTTLHELAEAITDPYGVGWRTWATPFGYLQIGDLCSPTRVRSIGPQGSDGGNVTLNGNRYQVQLLYSEVVRGCISAFEGQFINFNALGNKTYGDAPFALSADATSLLPVTFTAGGACTVSNALVTITGTGNCSITASQAGDKPSGGFYDPATPVTRTFTITPGTARFTFDLSTLPAKTYGDAPFDVSSYATKSADHTGAITFTTGSGSVGCSVTSDGQVTITGATSDPDECVIEASLSADSNYAAVTPISQSFGISKAASSVSVSCPTPNPTYTGSPITGCTATVSGAGGLNQNLTVTYAGRNDTTYAASTVPPTNAGDYTAGASFGGDTNHTGSSNSADFSIDRATPVLTWNNPASISSGTALSSTQLNATASVTGTFTYTPPAGTVLSAGNGQTLSVTFVPTDPTNYTNASSSVQIDVTQPPQVITGFYQPVNMGGVVNTVKGGSTVPLKFEVFADGNELTDTALVTMSARQIACTTGLPTDDIEEIVATGGTSLRYDTTSGQFIYNWKTPKQAGACYAVTATTSDGAFLTALFQLK